MYELINFRVCIRHLNKDELQVFAVLEQISFGPNFDIISLKAGKLHSGIELTVS
jgi:hypothetical protein